MNTMPKEELLQKIKLLSMDDLLSAWPISKKTLSRMTNHRNEAKRLPSYRFGASPMYDPIEVAWYREKHRFVPAGRKSK